MRCVITGWVERPSQGGVAFFPDIDESVLGPGKWAAVDLRDDETVLDGVCAFATERTGILRRESDGEVLEEFDTAETIPPGPARGRLAAAVGIQGGGGPPSSIEGAIRRRIGAKLPAHHPIFLNGSPVTDDPVKGAEWVAERSRRRRRRGRG